MHTRFNTDSVIFDLDGTLVDTAPDLTKALNHVLNMADRTSVSINATRHMVGSGARAMIGFGLEATGGLLAESELDDLFAAFLKFYEAHIAVDSRPFPGALAYIAKLRAEGLPVGLCTNKPEAMTLALLRALDMTDLFDAVLGGDTLDVKKPDARHVTETLSRMGSAATKPLFVGDSETDYLAARAAGVPVALVTFGYSRTPVEDLGADALISSYEDLL